MKKLFILTSVLLSVILLFTACSEKNIEDTTTESYSHEATTVFSGTTYSDMIKTIADAVAEGTLSTVAGQYNTSTAYGNAPENCGYAIYDINEDGTAELVFGMNDDAETLIFDLYTADEEGNAVHLFSGNETEYLCICTDNGLVKSFADDEGTRVEKEYTLDGIKLNETEITEHDGYIRLDITPFKGN